MAPEGYNNSIVKLMTPILRLLLVLTLAAPLAVQAVTLGSVRVNSYLNQPLDAEIDIIGLAPGQNEELRLRIANDAQLERLGIVYDQFLRELQFDVVQVGGRWVVRARSDRPVSEPFLDFAVQMSWPGGQMVKQYTLLLDPPTRIRPARAASAGRPAPAAAPAPARAAQVAVPESVGDSYGPVRSGETLWPIAQRLKPSGITTRQMAMALLRANPQAFTDGNVNKLRAGATLSIPPRAFIEELDAAAARAEFAAQTRRWQAPAVAASPRVLEGAVSAPPEPAGRPAETAETPPSPPPTPPENQDQLRIVTEPEKPAAPPSAAEKALREQLLVTLEEIESNRLTTSAMEERLSRLETELQHMQKLIELKDAQIEALQAEVSARAAIQEAARVAEPSAPGPAAPQLPTGLELPGQAAGPASAVAPPPPQGAVTVSGGVPVAVDETVSAVRPWYESYLWAVWLTLGLLGLTALVMMWRRPRPVPVEAPAADLPAFRTPAAAATGFAAAGAAGSAGSAALRKAEEDFRRLARERLGDDTAAAGSLPDLPELKTPVGTADTALDDNAESLLDQVLDENKLLDKRPGGRPASDYSDDDIAAWIKELGAEVDHVEEQSANDEALVDDDDIPSILNELDDQLGGRETTATPPRIHLEPLDGASGTDDEVPELLHEIDDQLAAPGGTGAPDQTGTAKPVPDDFAEQAFSMSLDLARAYLEIGDPDGARDMLQQALSGARDPNHRRQIEEMLKQID